MLQFRGNQFKFSCYFQRIILHLLLYRPYSISSSHFQVSMMKQIYIIIAVLWKYLTTFPRTSKVIPRLLWHENTSREGPKFSLRFELEGKIELKWGWKITRRNLMRDVGVRRWRKWMWDPWQQCQQELERLFIDKAPSPEEEPAYKNIFPAICFCWVYFFIDSAIAVSLKRIQCFMIELKL